MAGVLISGLIPLLQQRGLMPREEERQKLLDLLLAIQPVISDAEFRANEGDDVVRAWLSDLREVAYDADDIVDEFRYAKLWAEAETGRRRSVEKVSTNIFSCGKISSMNLPFFKGGVSRVLQGAGNRIGSVVSRIGGLVERMRSLNFQEGQEVIAAAERRQGPIFSSLIEIDDMVVGRDKEMADIVQFLLDPSNAVRETIVGILIMGMGGIGKTTLTRLVCNDARIKDHFECVLWVHVGEEFNIGKVSKSIIDQAIGKDCCLSQGDTDLLQRRTHQELSGKRYLLVLDHVGGPLTNLVQWLERGGGRGSSVIVTTRSAVAVGVYSFRSPYKCLLPPLMPDDLWELFCKRAFSDAEEICQEIRDIGKKIIVRCGGSPLAVNLMGGLMRFKKKPKEWLEVSNQLEKLNDAESLFPIFKVCYDNLSSEIKQCFVFCSVFPFGHYMDKEVLIKLWMANGLISSNGPTPMEERGDSIFNELALRHFFEDVKLVHGGIYLNKEEYHSRVVCKISNLVHDFARSVARNEYFQNYPLEQTSKIHHLYMDGDPRIDVHMELEKYPNVRTLLAPGDSFIRTVNCSALPKSNSLRALHLRSSLFDGDLLELKYMKHLRYLDLSGSRIKILPESTCSLHNLQTLNLSNCLLFYQLPENMRYMRSLRHLYLHKCPKLKRMPAHLRELSDLQTLSAYIIGEHAGNGIDEIRDLKLGGLLELYSLCKVKDAAKAKNANLVSKTKLESLTLCWGRNRLVMSKESNDLEVLEALLPHDGLKVLKVQQYGDPKFATWLANPVGLQNLVELHLIGCSQCETLPSVWRLSSLQVLCLKHMVSLICISSFTSLPGENSEGSSEMFPNLKRLVLVGLTRLKRWQEEETSGGPMVEFPLLDEMEITNCPNLISMPYAPKLKYLTLSVDNHRLLRSVITQSESLVEANIAKASSANKEPSLSFGAEGEWPNNQKLRVMRLDSTDSFFMAGTSPHSLLGFWRSLILLENLDIFNCKSLVSWPLEEFRNLNKLKRLSIRMCPNLTGLLPDGFQEGEELLPRLQALEFYGCPSLKEVPRCSSILYLELDECLEIKSISGLNNLEMLYLSCTNWTSLPNGLGDLVNLKYLYVSECDSLTCLPGELERLEFLQTLFINKCPRVKSLPGGVNRMLSSLIKLEISECPNLEPSTDKA